MKKVIILTLLAVVLVFGLVAQSDPFATRRFLNDGIEISFRTQDSEGRPQVYYRNEMAEQLCYYNFDEDYLVLYDENGNLFDVYGYSFINNGVGLRLFDENGRFFDLESDNGITIGDKVWEAVDTVFKNFLVYGGSGTAIGGACGAVGGPVGMGVGAAIGLAVGGVLGVGKALAHDIFGWI